MEVQKLVALYPNFYHMAEAGTWASIKAHGLLSTSAILDRHGVTGKSRAMYEEQHRPSKMTVGAPADGIVLRDQKPMAPDRLSMALTDGSSPQSWYALLNGMVFLWAEQERLRRLLSARHYRALEHDVLTIDSERLLASYASATWLCHMNSGNTFPVPVPRSRAIFRRIADYPVKKNGKPEKTVVEVVVDHSIPDIHTFVVKVQRMQADNIIAELPL